MTGTIGADTTLLIDFFSGHDAAVRFVEKNAGLIRVSELVVYEFLCGNLTDAEKAIFLKSVQLFPAVGVNREAVLLASELFRKCRKTGSPVGHQDVLIAGSYMAAGIHVIATSNAKHFSKLKGMSVLTYDA